jgi:hypothetical protein
MFDRAPLYDVIKEIPYVRNSTERTSSTLPDELPPLDLILIFNNEYGFKSLVRLYGVEFTDEGTVYSVNDLYSENTTQYVARDMDTMISYQDIAEFKDMMFARQVRGLFVDNRLDAMLQYKSKVEQQIHDTNNAIQAIDTENAKRVTAGIFTLGLSAASYYALNPALTGKAAVTRADLNKEKDKQLKIKTYLLKELERTQNEIEKYEQNINGWNGTQVDNITGGYNRDTIKHAPSKTGVLNE